MLFKTDTQAMYLFALECETVPSILPEIPLGTNTAIFNKNEGLSHSL